MKDLLIGLGLLSLPATVFAVFGTSGIEAFDEGTGAPASSLSFQQGGVAFSTECAHCHGRTARGTERGPNLIHPDYGAAKRSDAQFRRAIREGLTARQAGYQDMPGAPEMPRRKLDRLVNFLREVQRTAGIR
jgi:mono/diheme cytochrome c family protein